MNPKATNKRKNVRNATRDFKKDKEFKSAKASEQKYNDADWYIANDQLAKDVASLSFNTPLGNSQWINADGIVGAGRVAINMPGIMAINVVPAISPSSDATSAVNIAAKNLYSYVRHQNSGHSNYDSPDLMLYILAMDSIYAMISYMQGLYGTAMVFSQTNRYIGDALLTAKGVRASDIRSNLANFRAFINQYIVKASAFCVPRTMSLFKRHFWMFSNAFKDEPTTKSQMYVYRPGFLWQYNLDENNVGFLDPMPVVCVKGQFTLESRELSLDELKETANSLLEQLQYSEDINIMSGDILKAYGRENLWTMDLIPEGYGVYPVYSEEILDQIHNTVFTGWVPTSKVGAEATLDPDGAFRVTQRTTIGDGALLYSPKFAYATHIGYQQLLDIHSESPTPEEVLVSTRNMVSGFINTTGDTRVATIATCGSDLCLYADVYEYQNGTLNKDQLYRADDYAAREGYQLAKLTKFNKFPRFFYWDYSSLTPTTAPLGVYGEIDNFTVIDRTDLTKMHDTAMLSMLGVPTLGLVK